MSDSAEPELFPPPDEDVDSTAAVKPFLDHLEDLRWTLIKMIAAAGVSTFLSFIFARELLSVILLPLRRIGTNPADFLFTLEVTGGFMLAMKLAFYAGIVIACPALLYFLAEFILPALTKKEKKLLTPVFTGGVILFFAGVLLAYFGVIPAGLRFFIEYNRYLGISSRWTVDNYVSFVTRMCLAFGVCFELPMVVLVLAKLGVVSPRFLREKRPYVFIGILVVAALVTPTTDPFNMLLLAVPMSLLYEACVWIAWWMERRKQA